jgi:hypothetical protein
MSQLEKSDQKVFSEDNGLELQPMKEVTEDKVIDTNLQVPGPIPFAAWLIIVSKFSTLFPSHYMYTCIYHQIASSLRMTCLWRVFFLSPLLSIVGLVARTHGSSSHLTAQRPFLPVLDSVSGLAVLSSFSVGESKTNKFFHTLTMIHFLATE